MQVTAIRRGFDGVSLKEPGAHLEIPDEPRRKPTADDPKDVKTVQDKKGLIPAAFCPTWMRVGWTSEEPQSAPAPAASVTDAGESPI